MKSPSLVDSANIASVFSPVGDRLSITPNIETYYMKEFTYFKLDDTTQKLYALVSDQDPPSAFRFYSDFLTLEGRNQALLGLMVHYASFPKMAGMPSLLIPEHPSRKPNFRDLLPDTKIWTLVCTFLS